MDPRPRRAVPGQLPDRVYWIRRGLVLVALIVVIAVIAGIISAIRGATKTAAPATSTPPAVSETSPSPSYSATDQPTTVASSSSASPSVSAATSTSATATTPVECIPNLLSLAVSGPRSVPTTAKADLQVTITNSGSVACVFVFDTRFVLRVVSGSDEIWSTADCAAWRATGTQTLQPGAAATFKTTWDRHRSQKECKVVPTTLKSGTYVADASYVGAPTAQWPMTL